jgi:hypothetical protein
MPQKRGLLKNCQIVCVLLIIVQLLGTIEARIKRSVARLVRNVSHCCLHLRHLASFGAFDNCLFKETEYT